MTGNMVKRLLIALVAVLMLCCSCAGGGSDAQEHFGNEVITELAEKYSKTPAQIILRWHIQDGYIAIPGSSNPDHIKENFDIFDFELTDADMESIRSLDRQERYENW